MFCEIMFSNYEQTIFKLLNVCFLWSLMTHKYSQAIKEGSSKCTYGYEKTIYTAYCTANAKLTKFPKDLNRGIEGLYLTQTSIHLIDDNTFENLSNIKYLYLEHNSGLNISPCAFKPLKKLNTLDLAYNNVINTPVIEFPESLKQLVLTGVTKITTKSRELPISHLQELAGLSLSDCSLNEVPSFGGHLIGLESLDLTDNELKNMKLDSLANLCSLKKLFISPNAAIQDYCECVRVKKWIEDENIKGSNIICKSSKNNQTCNISPSSTFLETYNSCTRERRIKTLLRWFFRACIFLAVCSVCIGLLIELYILCNRKNFSNNTIRAYFLCQKN